MQEVKYVRCHCSIPRNRSMVKNREEFEVLTDDVTARNAIPQWIKEHGHEIVKIEESGIDLKVTIRKH